MATKPTVGVTDPSVARQLERQTAQQNLLAGNRSTVVTGDEVIYNQAVARTASVQNANSVTITQSTNNDPGDVTTVYSTSGALNVTSVDQTVNQYSVYNTGVSQIIAGNNITISSTIANGKGEVTINSTGGGSSYGNSNVTTLLAAFGSNTISTTGNVTVGNISHTSSNIFLIQSNGAKLELDHTGNGIAWLSPNTDSDLSGLYIDVDSYTMLYGENELRLESFNGNTHIRTATDSGNIEHHWEFTFSGNIILPGNTVAINFANGSPAFGNVSSINLDGSSSNVLYGNGVFASIGAVSGASGFSGYSGIDGASGFSGFSGIDGASGFSGIDGASGFSGIDGASGFSGFSGIDGASGFSGIDGASGYSGIDGASGYSGIDGASGFSGFSGFSGASASLPLANGNSNIDIATANGNVTISAVGNTIITVTGTGANVTGTLTTTGKIGYSSGSTVTQTGSRGNSVTINALSGEITLFSATMTANQVDFFTMTNNTVEAGDMIVCTTYAGSSGSYLPMAYVTSNTQAIFTFRNLEQFAISSPESPIIKFIIIKAPNA